MVVRDGRGRFANRPPYRVRGRLYVVVVGFGVRVGGRRLLGVFAEAPVGEYVGGGDAVVGGGVFVVALSDVVEDLDELESAVGLL